MTQDHKSQDHGGITIRKGRFLCGQGDKLVLVLAGMEAELEEFGFHGDAGDAEPAGSASLIALREINGAGEDFAFGIFEDAAMNIRNFTPTGGCEEFVDVIAKGSGSGGGVGGRFVENGLKMVDGNGVTLGEEESFADDIFEFAHVSRP